MKTQQLKTEKQLYTLALVFILITASVLRLVGWYGMPYQHDELSALFRLNVTSWGNLFEKGIMVDGHPALVQSFLFAWTGIFGTEEWIVKLPFVLCGIGAVYLSWKLASKWSSPAVALYCAAFMAVLQLPVFHSLHARPYAPGMLLLLWFALIWTKWLQTDKPTKSMYAQYVIAGLLCGLCHHFTGLGAVLLGVIGFFTIHKTNYKSYIITNALVIVCYLPYLPVTLAQLKFGGLGGENGWLRAPENTFVIDYLRHVFMYSPLMLMVLLATLVISFYKNPHEVSANIKWRMVALVMFSGPLLIGLLYSWFVSPIIQYSLLVFFLPFLFIFLLPARKQPVSAVWQLVMVCIILAAGTFALFFKRQYYEMAHTSVFKDAFSLTEECIKENRLKEEEGLFIFNENHTYLNFYNDSKLDFNSYLNDEAAGSHGARLLQETNKSYVILANPGSDLLAAARARYDFVFVLKQSFNCEIYYAGNDLISYAQQLKPVKKIPVVTQGTAALIPSTCKLINYNHLHQSSSVYYVPAEEEFSLAMTGKLGDLSVQYSDMIEIRAVFEIPDTGYTLENMPLVVFDLKDADSTYAWKSGVAIENKLNKEIYVVCMVRGSDVTNNRQLYLNKTFGILLWNLHHVNFRLKNLDMIIYSGNEKLYGVSSDIRK